ncbi:protein FAM207A [Drosophila pseudoobscura]|uniref:Protein FAM207A n=1 Tax=Drosophila pseudoobscura pseudoobscura TaxID=46245 RepID=A0A6I8UB66_DROPS|nr:protein FAM207A [Drosophila pseudoobscura]
MAKTKKNIRAKAKGAVGVAKQKAQDVQAQLNKSERQERLLHKTLTPKKTTTKKEKSALKHKKLLQRFADSRKERKNVQSSKKKPVVGDLKPLRDALPSLSDLYKLVKSKSKDAAEQTALTEPEAPLSVKQKIKKKRADIVNRAKSFEKLVKDKHFKENPRGVIGSLVRNKYRTMEEDNE